MLKRRGLIKIFDSLNEKIIAVCAPSGYGKTVAVTQWLEKDTRSRAILTLDEYDNDLSVFCERFCAALCVCQPQNKTLAAIVASLREAPDVFSLKAVSALSARKKAVLAIDDFHLLHDGAVLRLLLVLIKRLPKNFQIILISRHSLPAGFSELWLKGHILEINAEKLLFTDDEIKALYNKHGKQITQSLASDINRQTHGWAMGISFLLSDKQCDIYEYLNSFFQNIWEKWDEVTRDFMLRTAMLRDLTPSLCEAMTGVSDSEGFLKGLVQKGAFITRLQDGKYRYFRLFQEFLRRVAAEQGEEFLRSLYDTEGRWLARTAPLYHRGVNEYIGDTEKNLMTAGRMYEQGHLEKAYTHAVKAVADCDGEFTEAAFCATSILVYILDAIADAQGIQRLDGNATLREMSPKIEEASPFWRNFNALTVRRKIAAGNIQAAEEWLETEAAAAPALYESYAAFTTGRALIATGKYNPAIILLEKILKIITGLNRPLDIIEARILLAVAYWKKSRRFQNEALLNLEAAVLAAMPHGYVQMFLSESTVLAGILYKLQKRVEQQSDKGHLGFIKMLYLKANAGAIINPPPEPEEISIKFTPKQKKVMDLLCQGKTRKEIAEILIIRQPTLNNHIASIYYKLEVSRVTDAITRIKMLNLF